jgi:hypothetical protein
VCHHLLFSSDLDRPTRTHLAMTVHASIASRTYPDPPTDGPIPHALPVVPLHVLPSRADPRPRGPSSVESMLAASTFCVTYTLECEIPSSERVKWMCPCLAHTAWFMPSFSVVGYLRARLDRNWWTVIGTLRMSFEQPTTLLSCAAHMIRGTLRLRLVLVLSYWASTN